MTNCIAQENPFRAWIGAFFEQAAETLADFLTSQPEFEGSGFPLPQMKN